MARNVYTVRVLDSPALVESTSFSPVPIGSQFIISHMTATSQPGSTNWTQFPIGCVVYNQTTGVVVWALPAIPSVQMTLLWQGRYVLEYGDVLIVTAPGWDVTITAYSLKLP